MGRPGVKRASFHRRERGSLVLFVGFGILLLFILTDVLNAMLVNRHVTHKVRVAQVQESFYSAEVASWCGLFKSAAGTVAHSTRHPLSLQNDYSALIAYSPVGIAREISGLAPGTPLSLGTTARFDTGTTLMEGVTDNLSFRVPQ